MFQRRQRRFRRRQNSRSHTVHSNGNAQSRLRSNSFSNDQKRNNFRSPQSAEKLLEKYTTLAKEAISFGDKTLSENYFQHADHFMRIIEDKNKNRNQNKTNVVEKSNEDIKNFSKDTNIKLEDSTENKE
mgnify:CR=1 FL=1